MNNCDLTPFRKLSQFWGIILGLPILFLTNACQPRQTRWEPGEVFKTQIVVTSSFGTEFKRVELTGIMNKSTLAGEVVDFLHSPGDDRNGKLIGNKPLARFIEDDGYYIPADQTSLQMVTIYYHLQQLKELEIQSTAQGDSILPWPRKVALSVRIKNSPDMRNDNAFYNSRTDALYFVPYKDEAFPIPLNPGIIAHEHFHSFFSFQVLNPLLKNQKIPSTLEVTEFDSQKSLDDLYKLYVLKIVNEGLADVWGWIYSQDPDFVAVSLPKTQNSRNLDKPGLVSNTRVRSETGLKNEIRLISTHCAEKSNRCVGDNSYFHGTNLARSLKAFAHVRKENLKMSDDAIRKFMAVHIIRLIKSVHSEFDTKGTLNLDDVLLIWLKQLEGTSKSECQMIQDSVSSPGIVPCNE